MMDRRMFLGLGAYSFASLVFGASRILDLGDTYSVSILGDTHYDAFPKEKFHAKTLKLWEEKGWKHPMRLKEFERNAAMWQDLCKRILESSAKCVRPDTAFALQLGDLVQGDCEDDELHCKMLQEACEMLEKTYPGLPIVSVCGNHDIRQGHRNRGAAKAYAAHMSGYESKQLKDVLPTGVKDTTFGFRRGKDLWIMADFNNGKRSAKVVKELLAANPDTRYTFFTVHGPLLPSQIMKDRWFYLGEPSNDQERREIRALLAKRNAIVFSGHVHSLEHTVWEGDGGRITEMTLNTCAGRTAGGYFPAEPEVLRDKVEQYGTGPGAPKHSALYDEYKSGIKTLFNARAVGHHVLKVADDSVVLEYYGHDALKPTRTFKLR